MTAETLVREIFSLRNTVLPEKAISNVKYNKTVVHVDDDPAMLKIVHRKLDIYGIEDVSVQDPLKAIAVITQLRGPGGNARY